MNPLIIVLYLVAATAPPESPPTTERRITPDVDLSLPAACAIAAQTEMVKFATTHPEWRVVRFGCKPREERV